MKTIATVQAGLVGAAAAMSLLAGSANAEPSGTLTIGWAWDPGTMDPQMHRQRYTQIISHAMRDKLFYQEPPGLQPVPLLAESVTQLDDTTYEVKIHEGVLFHNGDELTADDVAFTFQRLWDPATESPRARMGNMANVENVEVVDRYTLRWTTKVPFGPPSTAVVGMHFTGQEILHKATYEDLSMDEARTHPPIGVGPFKFVEWVPDQRVVMEAFEDYWQGTPKVERIVWRSIPEESTRVAELLAGSVDMIHPVTPDFVDQLRGGDIKLEVVPGTYMRMLMMNVREGSPFHDPEVRRAMNHAIDRDAIVEYIYDGLGVANWQVAGSGQAGHIDGYKPFSYDPDVARPVLSQITEPIEMLVEPEWELAAEVVAEQLRTYGMSVTATVVDRATFNATNEAGDFDLLFAGGGYGSGQFTGAYYNNHFECSRLENDRIRTGFCDPDLDAKVLNAMQTTDEAESIALLEDVIRDLTEVHMPWVPLFSPADVWAMQPHVEGFTGSSAGQYFDLYKVSVEN
jgi:peptide/nickel transport system substrate-binding protein